MSTITSQSQSSDTRSNAKTLFAIHSLRDGFTIGAGLSLATGAASTLYWRPSPNTARNLFLTFGQRSLLHASRGGLAGAAVAAVLLPSLMGRRSTDELARENTEASRADPWFLTGEAVGAVTALVLARSGRLPALQGKTVTAVLGGAGLGATVGMEDYLLWNALTGGKRATVAPTEKMNATS